MTDLRTTLDILEDAMIVAKELDGGVVDDKETTHGKADAAERNRQLLNLADQLQLASSLVRNAYWDGKGQLSYDL